MKGNFHVQFLGEGVAATSPPYPTPGWGTTQVYPARITPFPCEPPVGESVHQRAKEQWSVLKAR